MTRVMIFGTFDHLHKGHEFVVHEAMKHGDVIAVVARDHHVKHIKNKDPMEPEDVRAQHLRDAFDAITVVLGDEQDFLAPVINHQPELILLGYDQQLPPGVSMDDLPCPVERLAAFEPEKYKSSLYRTD